MLYLLYNCDCIYVGYGGGRMKLFYNKNSKDPIYYAQVGIRNGKKVTTRNVKRFGKHSELLEITDDPPFLCEGGNPENERGILCRQDRIHLFNGL